VKVKNKVYKEFAALDWPQWLYS